VESSEHIVHGPRMVYCCVIYLTLELQSKLNYTQISGE